MEISSSPAGNFPSTTTTSNEQKWVFTDQDIHRLIVAMEGANHSLNRLTELCEKIVTALQGIESAMPIDDF